MHRTYKTVAEGQASLFSNNESDEALFVMKMNMTVFRRAACRGNMLQQRFCMVPGGHAGHRDDAASLTSLSGAKSTAAPGKGRLLTVILVSGRVL